MNFAYLLLGILVGVFSGFVGIGGGILIVPALVYLFHMDQHRAQGTSLGALLAPIGALAFWEYYKAGNADLPAAAWIAGGFLVGGYFGGMWAQQLSEVVLRRGFGVLLVIVGLRFLWALSNGIPVAHSKYVVRKIACNISALLDRTEIDGKNTEKTLTEVQGSLE